MSGLFNTTTMVFLIPIIAIVAGCVVAVVKMLIRHNERMAMIQQGMHPDDPSQTRKHDEYE